MHRSRLRFLTLAALVLSMLVVAACGSDNKSSSGAAAEKSSANQKEAIASGQKGGTLTQLGASDVDFLDPGHSYYTAGFQVIYATNRTLYSFKPEDGVNPVPDLAEAAPEVSADKKTVTVKIRKGVKFGPPVNREVTSKDVKYAVERFFSVNVGGQYPGYFSPIVGTPAKPTTGVKPISGITTPDDYTIVFKLSQPVGVSFSAALVMPITAPVPEEFAKQYDEKNPSTYNTHVISSGPYMVQNDASGNTTGYKAGKSITLVRNPNWDGPGTGDYRPAYLDKIILKTNQTNTQVAGEQVLDGSNLVLDTNPPSSILKKVVTQIKDQFVSVPSGGYRYFPMNTSKAPFNDINIRKAVMAGFSRNAARLARGDLGSFVMRACARIGRDALREARTALDADRFRDLVCGDDFVGVRIDDDERHLHRVQQVLFLAERTRRAIGFALRLAPVHFEAGEQHGQDRTEQRDGAPREGRSDAREECEEPGALGNMKRRNCANVRDHGVGNR